MSNHPVLAKALLSISTVAAISAGLVVIPAVSASAAVTVTAAGGGWSVNKRAGATTASAVVGHIPDRGSVSIVCYVRGQNLSGGVFRVTTNVWYRTSDGAFVWDGALQTFSNSVVTGPCDTPAPPASRTSTVKADRAVAWANSMIGSQAYNFLCERFVENAYGMSGRYGSAISAFYSLRSAGQMHYDSTGIPKGALAFSRGPLDRGYGHVMISRGNGSFVSGGASGPSVKVFNTPNPGSTFLGWAYAPASWQGR